jgi:RNA polymerase sigma-70 factor (ECF subfamily)
MEPKRRLPLGQPETGIGEIYAEYFNFICRNLRRLGVATSSMDDAVQDVFLVVHRRLAEFEARSSLKTWLFGIVLRVAREHRRSALRHAGHINESSAFEPDSLPNNDRSPQELVERREAARVLHAVLATMNDDRRAMFVLVELEQMSVPEVADELGIKLNTAYTRLRHAREIFEAAVARHAARDRRETR